MPVGDSFPPEKRKAYVDRNLKPWTIIRLYCAFITDPHDKFLVVVSAVPYLVYFFINSRPYRLAESKPGWKDTQVRIDTKNHPFLDYDSFIDCSRVQSLPIHEVEKQLVADISRIHGVVSDAVQAKVIRAVKENVTISRGKKKAILESLSRKMSSQGGKG